MNRTKWNNQVTFCVGDTIKVSQNIIEGEKNRIQIFQGIVIGIKGHSGLTSFTVRKIAAANVGVERIYPLNSPGVGKIEVIKKGKVKRAKLYHLRDRIGKKATKVKDDFVKKQVVEEIKSEAESKTKIIKEKPEIILPKAITKQDLKKEQREKRKAKKKKKIERKERKDVR